MLIRKLNPIQSIKFLKSESVLINCKSNKATTIKLAELDPIIDEEINNGAHYKRVKSFRNKIDNTIPVYLEMAVNEIIKRHKTTNFIQDVKEMNKRIYHCQLPPEQKEIQVFTKEIEAKFVAKEKRNLVNCEELSESDKLKIYHERTKKIEESVRKKIFSWKEFNWTDYQSVVYMASRLPANYQATKFVFNEIQHIDPDFKPKTLFDFGSGLGTTMHVANEIWPATIHEHVNIESSKPMINLCDLLLKNGNDSNPSIFNNVFYKQFLQVSRRTTYDLVVSAFSLKELPSVDARINVIENLWHKTNDIIVFIEHGNQAGTAAILEARSFILKLNGYDPVAIYNPSEIESNDLDRNTKNPNVHIMSPCPHHYCCPRLNKEYGVWCNFQVNFFPINMGQRGIKYEKERFSYVVFRKRPKSYTNFPSWPRVVQEPRKSNKLVDLKLCTPEGKIEHIQVSKGKHTRNAYDCARACKWGDQFACKIIETDKDLYKSDKKSKFKSNSSDEINSESFEQ